MDRKVLVAYASKYGATREIAEKIGESLTRAGLQVDVVPVGSVRDLSSYRAVILGSAIYIGKWQKEAEAFIQSNQKTLADRPVWIFSSGPTGEGDPVGLVEGWRLPSNLKPVIDRIQPRDIAVFHGHIDPEKVNFMERFVVKNMVKKPFGDFRNWESIQNWAVRIAVTLQG